MVNRARVGVGTLEGVLEDTEKGGGRLVMVTPNPGPTQARRERWVVGSRNIGRKDVLP